jgi:hypothetical protein
MSRSTHNVPMQEMWMLECGPHCPCVRASKQTNKFPHQNICPHKHNPDVAFVSSPLQQVKRRVCKRGAEPTPASGGCGPSLPFSRDNEHNPAGACSVSSCTQRVKKAGECASEEQCSQCHSQRGQERSMQTIRCCGRGTSSHIEARHCTCHTEQTHSHLLPTDTVTLTSCTPPQTTAIIS